MTDTLEGLAAIDYTDAFCAFSAGEGTTLRRFHQLCQSLGESEFMQLGVRFSLRMGLHGANTTLDHAGDNHLRAFMSDFRQLWMEKERTRFQTVRNLIRANAVARGTNSSDTVVALLDPLGKRYKEGLKEPLMYIRAATGASLDLRPANDHDTSVTVAEVVEGWLYSGPEHWDEETAVWRSQWSPTTYEYSLSKAVHSLCDIYWELDVAVQSLLGADGLVPADTRDLLWRPPGAQRPDNP